MKIKRFFGFLLALVMALGSVNVGFAEESGTVLYEISTAEELHEFAAYVNEGNTSANAVLTADIAVNEGDIANCGGTNSGSWKEWTPIGSSTYKYAGTFDGQGYTISGLYYNDTSASYAGLFGYTSGASISNVSVDSSYIGGYRYVGGICGYADNSTITNCANLGTTIDADRYVGGICGYAHSDNTITSCENLGTITGADKYVGGICGRNSSSTITNCYYFADTAEGGINGSDVEDSAEAKTAEEFANGSVAWLLNGETAENAAWYQNLNNEEETDSYPVLDSTHGTVYISGIQYCPNSIDAVYTNTVSEISILSDVHTYGSDGICTACGISYKEPETADSIYQISNKGELYWFEEYVNDGNTSANAVLTADIAVNDGDIANCGGTNSGSWLEWTPMGKDGYPYAGTFDGQGYTISGLYYNDTTVSYAGLFGYTSGASISNVSVENSYICGYNSVGGICGYLTNSGTVTSCINMGNISGSSYAGGICGRNSNSTITNCYYLADTAAGGINSSDVEDSAEAKTTEEFANGSVAWVLNGETAENAAWYQNLNNGEETDSYPVLDSTHGTVYCSGTQYCPYSIAAVYTNTVSEISILSDKHTYGSDGVCTACGISYKEPETADGIYQISNKGELYWFAEYVNAGNTSANAVLTADIAVNDGDIANCGGTNSGSWTEWTPIGKSTYPYAGTFDGQGYTISGLYYNDTTVSYVGLFGYTSGAAISNVSVENSCICGYNNVGGICGWADSSTITNCTNKGTVSSSDKYIGGICGYAYNNSMITKCANLGTITGESDYAGGICGCVRSSSTAANCSNLGTITGASDYTGGICGFVRGSSTTANCINMGNISGSSCAGGICGDKYSDSTVTNCYYLAGTAEGGINSSDVSGSAEVKTSEEFESGNVAWLLNGETAENAVWYQNIGSDEYPVLDDTHGTVHIVVDDGSYTNDDIEVGDVSGNGKITSLDATLVLKYISGIDVSLNLDAADANNDGEININDAVKILNSITA